MVIAGYTVIEVWGLCWRCGGVWVLVGVAGCSDCLRLGVVLGWFRVWVAVVFGFVGALWVCGLASGLGVWIDCWLGWLRIWFGC